MQSHLVLLPRWAIDARYMRDAKKEELSLRHAWPIKNKQFFSPKLILLANLIV